MNRLSVGRVDDTEVLEHVFLLDALRNHLTDREHAVLALRMSGFTRPDIVLLLGIGKTTAYTCEREAKKKLKRIFQEDQEEGDKWRDTDTDALFADGQ